MKNIFRYVIEEPLMEIRQMEIHYIGDTMYLEVSNQRVIKLEFVKEEDPNYGNIISKLKATIIDSRRGEIDQVTIPFETAFQEIERPNQKFMKCYRESKEVSWAAIPTAHDFKRLALMLNEYISFWR